MALQGARVRPGWPAREGDTDQLGECVQPRCESLPAHLPGKYHCPGMQFAEDPVRADGLTWEPAGLAQQVQQRDRLTAGEVRCRGLRGRRSDVHQLIVRSCR